MSGLDALRLLIGAGFLTYASVLDLRTRRVPNNVWIALGFLAALLFIFDWAGDGRFTWITALVALGGILLMYVLWYVHILAGGADAKALMAISILLPQPIVWSLLGATFPLWPSPMPGVIVVLANSVLAFALAPFALFLVNLVRGDVRFPAMLLGYRMPLSKTRDAFVWVVDHVNAEGKRRQLLFPSAMSDEDYDANLERLEQAGEKRVWVTPKIPFMVPLLFGFLGTFFVGDILFRLVTVIVERLR
ncbi:MAG TPA: A24 family peptidase C-terminal domain-containing protein [Candidatus Thermoplasmatota archaeon]